MPIDTPPLAERLPSFFSDWVQIGKTGEKPSLLGGLHSFFDRFAQYRHADIAPGQRSTVDARALAAFFAEIKEPLMVSRQGAFHFDPWEVAGLGRDEVRNVGVLAWLFDPRGSHGFGGAALSGLLAAVNRKNEAIFPMHPEGACRVRTEINPNGEIADRVDIEIDAQGFYLIVEAKIDAPEQTGQIERYCHQARERAKARPWAVIFLTPYGRKPATAGSYESSRQVVPLSWNELARSLTSALPETKGSSLRPASRQSAEFAARRFMERIRLF